MHKHRPVSAGFCLWSADASVARGRVVPAEKEKLRRTPFAGALQKGRTFPGFQIDRSEAGFHTQPQENGFYNDTRHPNGEQMDIPTNKILPIGNPNEYKIHFAVWNGKEQPLDVFVRDPEEWKGWNSWRGKRDDYNRKFIFSLMRYYHLPDKWLFGGIFEVIERNTDSYTVNLAELYREYIGRLLIHYPGPGIKGRAFCFERHFNELKVAQIFDKPFEGEAFCGYENVEHGFAQLESIIKQNKPDWKSALANVKGVYLIVDKKNGKMYVGSAYGDSGIWSRWACYIGTGHGWNDELTKLINANGIDYARENFLFSILEFRSMRTDDQVIIAREQYWKRILQTNVFGYNRN